jgi:hypothetical protein
MKEFTEMMHNVIRAVFSTFFATAAVVGMLLFYALAVSLPLIIILIVIKWLW